ncbi:MAG: beta-ketoacyl-[acyl-carrier-protein] synthase family protein, partial [Deltaproteobacteria bacterium]|nr:beta-ketoacyl-[acyl-carrier-protein] synthase family protein [Deltaproteobacteria bacterium]
MKYRVAITGLGIVSSLGNSADSVAKALYQGHSGIVADPERVRLGFLSALTG